MGYTHYWTLIGSLCGAALLLVALASIGSPAPLMATIFLFGLISQTYRPAASAVVGLLGREGAVIRLTLIPFVYYALLPASVGYAIVWASSSGWFNLGSVLAVSIMAGVVLATALTLRRSKRPEVDPAHPPN